MICSQDGAQVLQQLEGPASATSVIVSVNDNAKTKTTTTVATITKRRLAISKPPFEDLCVETVVYRNAASMRTALSAQ
jgi:hypothetical protein